MKTRQITTKLTVVSLVVLGLLLIVVSAGGSKLEPNAPPGPTMHTLDEIYSLVSTGQTQTPPRPFTSLNYYLKFDDIAGESTEDKHKDWIEVLSYNSEIRQSPGAVGTALESDLRIVKKLDKASPNLFDAVCRGKVFPKVEIHLCDPDADLNYNFMKIVLSDALVTGIRESPTLGIRESPTGASADSFFDVFTYARPLEEISFNYTKIEWTYTEANGTQTTTSWDRTAPGNL